MQLLGGQCFVASFLWHFSVRNASWACLIGRTSDASVAQSACYNRSDFAIIAAIVRGPLCKRASRETYLHEFAHITFVSFSSVKLLVVKEEFVYFWARPRKQEVAQQLNVKALILCVQTVANTFFCLEKVTLAKVACLHLPIIRNLIKA